MYDYDDFVIETTVLDFLDTHHTFEENADYLTEEEVEAAVREMRHNPEEI